MSKETIALMALSDFAAILSRSIGNCTYFGTDLYRDALESDLGEFLAALKMVILEVKLDEEKIMKSAEGSFQRRCIEMGAANILNNLKPLPVDLVPTKKKKRRPSSKKKPTKQHKS